MFTARKYGVLKYSSMSIDKRMPEPTSGIDYYVYKFLVNPVARKMCGVHPNYISVAGGLFGLPMMHNMYAGGSAGAFVFYAALRLFLDDLDGSVARACNLKSDMGALLDVTTDTVVMLLVGAAFIYKMIQRRASHKYNDVLIGIQLLLAGAMINQTQTELEGTRTLSFIEQVVHDNLSLSLIVLYYVKVLVLSQSPPDKEML